MTEKVQFELGTHREQAVIFIRFDRDAELVARVKKLVGVRWSQSSKAWYVTDSAQYRSQFGLEPKPLVGKDVLLHIDQVNQDALRVYVETLQLKAYSQNTINTYRNEFAQLLHVLKNTYVNDLDAEKLRSYFLYCVNTLKLSENTIHSRMNAVKFYFEQVLHLYTRAART
jgi:integrase/recombinase XerD